MREIGSLFMKMEIFYDSDNKYNSTNIFRIPSGME